MNRDLLAPTTVLGDILVRTTDLLGLARTTLLGILLGFFAVLALGTTATAGVGLDDLGGGVVVVAFGTFGGGGGGLGGGGLELWGLHYLDC